MTPQGRRYEKWHQNPNGLPYRARGCIAEVRVTNTERYRQCEKREGHGPGGHYCHSHAAQLRRGFSVRVPPMEDLVKDDPDVARFRKEYAAYRKRRGSMAEKRTTE